MEHLSQYLTIVKHTKNTKYPKQSQNQPAGLARIQFNNWALIINDKQYYCFNTKLLGLNNIQRFFGTNTNKKQMNYTLK